MYNTLAFPTLLYGSETCAIGETDKCRMMSEEIKFVKRIAKYRRRDCEPDQDILSELKINPLNAELNSIYHFLILLRDLTFMGKCSAAGHTGQQRKQKYSHILGVKSGLQPTTF
jgi:hypothetical protein